MNITSLCDIRIIRILLSYYELLIREIIIYFVIIGGFMRTALTELLQIEYPIIQGAMAWVSEHKLVAAVANAGATGVIALGGRDAEWTRNEIRACKELTDKPFGVNLMLMAPNKDELVNVIRSEEHTSELQSH